MELMSCKPLVSVLIPVYKVEKYIEKCVTSVFEQDYENLQILLVDDCSPDNSIAIVKNMLHCYPKRINQVSILQHNINQGLAAARNTAVQFAKGEYLLHLDSDDYLVSKSCITDLVEEMILEDADVAIFDIMHVFPNKTIVESEDIPQDKDEYLCKIIERKVAVCVCGGIYKTSLYKDFHIEAPENLNYGEDYATKPRLLYRAEKIIHIKRPYYAYTHINANSYTNQFKNSFIKEQLAALCIIGDFFSSVSNKERFLPSIRYAYSRIKAELLIAWGIGGGTCSDLQEIRSIRSQKILSLSLKYRIALFLSSYPILLSIYSKTGIFIKKCKKLCLK